MSTLNIILLIGSIIIVVCGIIEGIIHKDLPVRTIFCALINYHEKYRTNTTP